MLNSKQNRSKKNSGFSDTVYLSFVTLLTIGGGFYIYQDMSQKNPIPSIITATDTKVQTETSVSSKADTNLQPLQKVTVKIAHSSDDKVQKTTVISETSAPDAAKEIKAVSVSASENSQPVEAGSENTTETITAVLKPVPVEAEVDNTVKLDSASDSDIAVKANETTGMVSEKTPESKEELTSEAETSTNISASSPMDNQQPIAATSEQNQPAPAEVDDDYYKSRRPAPRPRLEREDFSRQEMNQYRQPRARSDYQMRQAPDYYQQMQQQYENQYQQWAPMPQRRYERAPQPPQYRPYQSDYGTF